MARSRRLVIDDNNSWLLRGHYATDLAAGSDGTVDHGDADYIVLSKTGSGDEALTVTPALYGDLTTAFQTFVVWGKGVISFGQPTDAQIAFMTAATAGTDLSAFPGPFIEAGYEDPVGTDIFIGIRNPNTVGLQSAYTEVQYADTDIFIYADHIYVSSGAAVIDLGTGVRLNPADGSNGNYHLASLITVDGTPDDDVINGTAAAQSIHGHDGNDTLTAGSGAVDLYGEAGNDTLKGGPGYDRLYGGDGNDNLTAGPGDQVDAGAGNDTITAARSTGIQGGDGTDHLVLDFTGETAPVAIALGEGADNQLAGVGITYSGIEQTDIFGGAGNDTLTGNSGANSIDGGSGRDAIGGGAGDDVLSGGIGNQAPEPAVASGGGTQQDAVAIDSAFNSAGAGQDPVAILAVTASIGAGQSFYNITAAEGAHLLVEGGAGTGSLNTYTLSLLDSEGTVIADNSLSGALEVAALSAGVYTIEVDAQVVFGPSIAVTTSVKLSSAMPSVRHNVLTGGTGDDTYLIHLADDAVIEKTGEGTDAIITDVSYALPGNVEALTLRATFGAINGMGNALDNTITGNESANTLNGGSGNDTLIGAGGSDLLRGDSGADRMEGGTGNDAYRVDNPGDVVVEKSGEGTDKVYSSISLKLADNVENLILTGTKDLAGTGNALANQLTGNSGANVLDGGAGIDVMLGGAGNDTYHVDNRSDRVYETLTAKSAIDAGGIDTVMSTATYSLLGSGRQFVENLTLVGGGAIDGTGNDLANRISGTSGANLLTGNGGNDTLVGYDGNDRLDGGAGNDILIGGNGNDRLDPGRGKDALTGNGGADFFQFGAAAIGDAGTQSLADRISDFSHAQHDRIDLHTLDANPLLANDQAFTFIGTASFGHHAGELRYEQTAMATYISGDMTGDGVADFFIRLAPGLALIAGDFVL